MPPYVCKSVRFLIVICALLPALTGNLNSDEKTSPALRYTPNNAFGLGERLTYDVGYKFISAGTAVFDIADKVEYVQGRPCYKISFQVASHKSLDFLYKVRDTYRSYVDVDGIFPWKFTQQIRERNYSKDYSAEFDQYSRKAKTSDGTFDTPEFVHDVVSAFYYVRTFDLKNSHKGDIIKLHNFVSGKTHPLDVHVLGRERIEVTAGVFDCVVVEPKIAAGSPFGFKGRLVLWLSDDERKIPIKVRTQIPIGSIDTELKYYEGTRGAITAKVR